MSLIHSRSTCKGKGQEAQFDFSVRLFFFLDVGEQEELATGRKGKVRIFQGLEKHFKRAAFHGTRPWVGS